MKKFTIFLLLFALLTGCTSGTGSEAAAAETDAPLTFGNAVITDAPETQAAIAALEAESSTQDSPVVGYIWQLQSYGPLPPLQDLQYDGAGGFWGKLMDIGSDYATITLYHCDGSGQILSETTVPREITGLNSACEPFACSSQQIYYEFTDFRSSGGGDTPPERNIYIESCNVAGEPIFSLLLSDLSPEASYISSMAPTDNGCLISTDFEVFALDTAGNLLWQTQCPDEIGAMIQNKDGTICLQTQFPSNIYRLDLTAHSLSEPLFSLDKEAAATIRPGVLDYDLLLCDNASNTPKFYGLDLSTGAQTPLWDCGAMGMSSAGTVIETSAGALVLDYISLMYENCLGQLVQTPIYEDTTITTLTLGTVGELSPTATSAIAMFNSLYPEYYLETEYYPSTEQLNLAIISGEGPDIICLDGLSQEEYARNGHLLDLLPFLNGEDGPSQEDLVPEYLAEYTAESGLCRLSPVFSWAYMGADTSLVSTSPDSFGDYLAAAKEAPDVPTWEVPAQVALSQLIHFSLTAFVDFDTGTANFDTQEFYDLLELASLGRQLTQEEYPDTHWLYSPASIDIWSEDLPQGGFPAAPVLTTEPRDTFGIYASSQSPEAAWNFFALLLSEDIQRAYTERTGYFPILTALYEETVPQPLQAGLSQTQGHYISVSPLFDIISEEAEAYFSGDISLETAAQQIQSRSSIYLGEIQ